MEGMLKLYSPINELKQIGEDIWIVDGNEIHMSFKLFKVPFTTRMTIVKIDNNKLWIHSPIAFNKELNDKIKELGDIEHIMICTPFTGQTGERGIIMRYSFEFKLECIEMYERGEFPDTPDGVSTKRFRDNIRQWKRMVDSSGIDSLQHKPQNRKWKPEEKLELIVKVLAGESCTFVALSNGIQPGMLYQWVNKYKTLGYNGLEESKKGRPPKDKNMKKNNKTHAPKLNETEYEELIRLRAENEHIKTEIEVIKKSIALRREKWAAQLEAKKQRSSKNL